MTTEQIELLDSIRELARAIHRDTGLYTTHAEHLHPGEVVGADVSVQMPDGRFHWWRGSSSPITGHQVEPEDMREQMLVWLAEWRKEKAP